MPHGSRCLPASKPRILIVEDDRTTLALIGHVLTKAGYEPVIAEDGYRGLALALDAPCDLIILDWMLPDLAGIEVCRRLRQQTNVPIIMLTRREVIPDRVAGVQAGADDYVIKPVAPEELLARVAARLRTMGTASPEISLRYEDLTLWPGQRRVWRGDREIQLTQKEYELLLRLMQSPEVVKSHQQLMDSVWGPDFDGESNVLEAYVKLLRKKLESEGEPRLVYTVRSVGYVMRMVTPAGAFAPDNHA
ncbi:MAG: response regulator transcription factor [Candidatus Sericytochromatia bacterium]|nr:response regulator transcription factor [Candidatus Sericytochromatia bacterium]